VTRSSVTPRGRSTTGVGFGDGRVGDLRPVGAPCRGSGLLTGQPSTASMGGRRAARARTAVDLPVPRSPKTRTPPIIGSMAVRTIARRMSSWPTMAVKGKGRLAGGGLRGRFRSRWRAVMQRPFLYPRPRRGGRCRPRSPASQGRGSGRKVPRRTSRCRGRPSSRGVRAHVAGEFGHAGGVGPDREGDLVKQGNLADADLEEHVGVLADDGPRCRARGARTTARGGVSRWRGSARRWGRSGPCGSMVSVRGFTPAQLPRAEKGARKTVQSSTAWARQRVMTLCCAMCSCARARSGQTAKIAQTDQFGRGVNPSPVPEPHSLTNRAPDQRWRDRASAICPITQSRLAGEEKRKRLSVATEMSRSSGPSVRTRLHLMRRLGSQIAFVCRGKKPSCKSGWTV
jgi:hypothetical protein